MMSGVRACMAEDRPSLTALLVAMGRGIGTGPKTIDAWAPRVMPPLLGVPLTIIQRFGRLSASVRWALRLVSVGMVDHVCLRTQAIDSAIAEGITQGCTQLVVLGAGLDVRAWRMPVLSSVDVFEVDHPSTQADKRRRIEHEPPLAASVRFIAVDFSCESVAYLLAEVGHDAKAPTFWLWEGVTPYLDQGAIDATLADVAEQSASGSKLAMTYAVTQLSMPRLLQGVVHSAFALLGEPLSGLMSQSLAASRIRKAGFTVIDDTNSVDWGASFEGSTRLARPFSSEHLLVARHD